MKLSLSFFSFGRRGKGRGREEGGLGEGGEKERQQELLLPSYLPLPAAFSSDLFFWLLLTRAGLTTRLPYPRGSLPL